MDQPGLPARRGGFVPAKKTRPPAEGVRYLLSADRRFRRLSLKKISARLKTARRRSGGRSTPKAVKSSATAPRIDRQALSNHAPIVFILVSVVSVGVLAGWFASPVDTQVAGEQQSGVSVSRADVASAAVVATPLVAPTPAPLRSRAPETAVERVETPARVETMRVATPARVETVRVATPARVEALARTVVPPSSPAEAGSASGVVPLDRVTISGCLEYDGKSAWLKDASGDDAPRSRSWRSGFLRKRSPRIALGGGLTDAPTYDGRRVTVTGVLVDREMRVDSLKPSAGDCD
jgi:hypothetical protein